MTLMIILLGLELHLLAKLVYISNEVFIWRRGLGLEGLKVLKVLGIGYRIWIKDKRLSG